MAAKPEIMGISTTSALPPPSLSPSSSPPSPPRISLHRPSSRSPLAGLHARSRSEIVPRSLFLYDPYHQGHHIHHSLPQEEDGGISYSATAAATSLSLAEDLLHSLAHLDTPDCLQHAHSFALTKPQPKLLSRPLLIPLRRRIAIDVDRSNEIMAHSAPPDSPPDLTSSSKSSMSSSFPSSQFEDLTWSDKSHFEEIGLEDDIYPPTPLTRRTTPSQKWPTLAPRNAVTGATVGGRELTSSRKPSPTTAAAAAAALAATHLNSPLTGHGNRRGLVSPSAPSLTVSSRRRRPRSQSPGVARPVPNSLTANSSKLRRNGSSGHLPRLKSRADTWQSRRKSVQELEDEYDKGDSDGDVPDDASLWNVPISPLPRHDLVKSMPGSLSTSPERQAQLSAAAIPSQPTTPAPKTPSMGEENPPSPSSTTFQPTLVHSNTIGAYPLEQQSPTFRAARAKSWTVAMNELSEETRSLTQALEAYAEANGGLDENHYWGNTRPRAESHKRNKTTLVELPPIRKGNIMIDPLPISKEKEAVLSRTRPSWLPPKSQKEEKRHLKEYQRIMQLSLEAEKKRELKERREAEARDATKTHILRIWDDHILPHWDRVICQPRTRELWWRGIAPRSRGTVWQRAIGNELALTHASYPLALKRAKAIEAELERDVADGIVDERRKRQSEWFKAIRRDVKETYPELKIFQHGGPLHTDLVDVCMAYAFYRSDVGYCYGNHLITALLLLNLPAAAAFSTLANLLNRSLPLAFLTNDAGAIDRAYTLTLSTLQYKLPTLHQHLINLLHIPPHHFLEPLFRSLFCIGLPIDLTSRLWDVYIFEGDAFLIRAAIGILAKLESSLYGSQAEILKVLGWGARGWNVGSEEAFMEAVRAAGREEVVLDEEDR
ncbi:MAG: hypothetical protein M1829_005403 [Trizodia sp. TS-e1964]|nr:MAG: hypothetical protein M1829_005403 [Trizodia sp. TS-e1964]